MRIYPVKENPIGSSVSEILRYKHTDKQTSCYFSIRIICPTLLVDFKELHIADAPSNILIWTCEM